MTFLKTFLCRLILFCLCLLATSTIELEASAGECAPPTGLYLIQYNDQNKTISATWVGVYGFNEYYIVYTNEIGDSIVNSVTGTSAIIKINPDGTVHTLTAYTACEEEEIALGPSSTFSVEGSCEPPTQIDARYDGGMLITHWQNPPGVEIVTAKVLWNNELIAEVETDNQQLALDLPYGTGLINIIIFNACTGTSSSGWGAATILVTVDDVDGICDDPYLQLANVGKIYYQKTPKMLMTYLAPGLFCNAECPGLGMDCKTN